MNNHVTHQLPDYTLNLLPRMERQAVERHTAVCPQCRHALQSEREIGQMVRLTLQTATQPANGRLRQIMPPVPARKQRGAAWSGRWQRQLALVGLLVMIVLGGFGLNGRTHNNWGVPSPTSLAATATSTQNATATIARRETIQAKQTGSADNLRATAAASPLAQPTIQARIAATPAPQPVRMSTN